MRVLLLGAWDNNEFAGGGREEGECPKEHNSPSETQITRKPKCALATVLMQTRN